MSWLSRSEAVQRLGVKPQTLYAYVSRGLVAAKPDPADPRASLYAAGDIAACLRRRRSGRRRTAIAANAIAWGDPVMTTRITTVRDGRLIYAGRDAVMLARSATLEDVARLLWEQRDDWSPQAPKPGPPVPGESGKARGLAYLARRASEDPPSFGRARAALAQEAFELLKGLADAFVGAPGRGPFHERLARSWLAPRSQWDHLRRALVLVADHELNPSTFAARVAASTGAPLAAAALAGYATLTGPLHGEASTRALAFLRQALTAGADAAVADVLARGERIPAVGHALYPDGDPRAHALLATLRPPAPLRRAIAAAEAAGGERANIDMALAVLTLALELPDEAPFVLFAAGRMVGWMAHAIEQRESGRPIRPRAAYRGR